MAHDPNPVHEVQDMRDAWVFFERLFGGEAVEWTLPRFTLFGHEFVLTKFMLLELVAAALILLIFIPLARRIRSGGLPQGRFWNLFEGLLLFIRDEIARPNIGDEDHGHEHADHGHAHTHNAAHGHLPDHPVDADCPPGSVHEADKYVPFLWTLFLFVLFCNLLGMFPMMGSPTASIWMTGGLALISFTMLNAAPIAKVGPKQYFLSLWPHIDMPPGAVFSVMGVGFTLMIGMIEIMGMFIKSGVLAVRLFANMFAGHLVLANILFFIYLVGNTMGMGLLWGTVTAFSVLGVVALSLLELFVAFLQAYIFTFLTALFMGMNLHHASEH
ncbi:MAG: F0F1 ATP synthase subunit A [Gemmataceae bacterium]